MLNFEEVSIALDEKIRKKPTGFSSGILSYFYRYSWSCATMPTIT